MSCLMQSIHGKDNRKFIKLVWPSGPGEEEINSLLLYEDHLGLNSDTWGCFFLRLSNF